MERSPVSIIAAINDTANNVVWVGSNGRATLGSLRAPSVDRKWKAMNGWLIGVTGSGPKLEALDAHGNEFPDPAEHPFEVLKFMKSAYDAFDIGDTDEGLKRYCGSGLLVDKSGRIWDFDNSFCLTEVESGALWAQGSGMEIAIGAAAALAEFIPSPRERLTRAVQITIDKDVDCPGELIVQSFDRNGVLSPLEVAS